MYKNEGLKRLNNSVKYENGNEKWEMRIELWINKKRFFFNELSS